MPQADHSVFKLSSTWSHISRSSQPMLRERALLSSLCARLSTWSCLVLTSPARKPRQDLPQQRAAVPHCYMNLWQASMGRPRTKMCKGRSRVRGWYWWVRTHGPQWMQLPWLIGATTNVLRAKPLQNTHDMGKKKSLVFCHTLLILEMKNHDHYDIALGLLECRWKGCLFPGAVNFHGAKALE